MKVQNYGQVRCLELPGEWQEVSLQREPLARKQAKLFVRAGERNQQVRLILRGGAAAAGASDALFVALSEPPHPLTKSEQAALSTVLADLADEEEFAVGKSETALIGNRVVICLEGNWKRQQLWTRVLITVEPKSETVQQLEFLCPAAQRAQFEPIAEQILSSVQWN